MLCLAFVISFCYDLFWMICFGYPLVYQDLNPLMLVGRRYPGRCSPRPAQYHSEILEMHEINSPATFCALDASVADLLLAFCAVLLLLGIRHSITSKLFLSIKLQHLIASKEK